MPDVSSQDLDALAAAGGTDRVFVLQRSLNGQAFVVRPGVLLADGNQIRFRNFTEFRVRIQAAFLSNNNNDFVLARKGDAGDRRTVNLAPSPAAGFHEYVVLVLGTSGGDVEAVGDSRPGVIIDR